MWNQTRKKFTIPGLDGLQSRACETAKRVGINAVKLRVFHYDTQEDFRRKFVPMYCRGAKAVGNDPCFGQITEMRRQQYCRYLRTGLILGRTK